MEIEFVAAEAALPEKAVLAVVVFEGEALGGAAEGLDKTGSGALSRAVGAARFTGAKGQTLDLLAPAGVEADRLLLVGAGNRQLATNN